MNTRRSKVSAEDYLTNPRRTKTLLNGMQNSPPIPIDLIMEILSRLPAKSIARCRCVSKRWTSMLRRPDFTELFLIRSRARPRLLFYCENNGKMLFLSTPQVQSLDENSSLTAVNHRMKFPCGMFPAFRGCVRGFVCFASGIVPVICNPSTGQYVHSLPKLMMKRRRGFRVNTFFGYDPVEKQYKILSMTSEDGVSEEHQVLTLGTGKLIWRSIECCIRHYPLDIMICIDGVLYYRAKEHMCSRDNMIVCFDFRTETFKVIKLIELAPYGATLANYNGKLAAFISKEFGFICGRTRSFAICVLEDLDNHIWSKHVYELSPVWHTLVGHTHFTFGGMTGTNEILLSPHFTSYPFYVFYYNIESKTIKRVEIQGMDEYNHRIVHTLVDHVENVKLMEMSMSNTYNLRSSNSS